MRRLLASPHLWLLLCLIVIAMLLLVSPIERTLGVNVRVVYLHGAWVWVALVFILASAGAGLIGLITRQEELQLWSRALGRTGLTFWVTYLPISLWAMEANWNGLFLAEPRWRLGLTFAIAGLLLQSGLALVGNPAWAAAFNVIYAFFLMLSLQTTEQVLHPSNPIFGSDAWRIQLFFVALFVIALIAAWQLTRWFRSADTRMG